MVVELKKKTVAQKKIKMTWEKIAYRLTSPVVGGEVGSSRRKWKWKAKPIKWCPQYQDHKEEGESALKKLPYRWQGAHVIEKRVPKIAHLYRQQWGGRQYKGKGTLNFDLEKILGAPHQDVISWHLLVSLCDLSMSTKAK